ncbi:MAG TPA: AraC family transcriptional regulator [Bacteroidia bacterium]|nr:AraC family transcriptional regulator [Bacteroidia bacterium]
MSTEIIRRIVDAMEVRFHHAHIYEVLKPYQLLGAPQNKSILFYAHSGYFTGGVVEEQIKPGNFYLIPKGTVHFSRMGGPDGPKLDPNFLNEDTDVKREYVKDLSYDDVIRAGAHVGSSLGFELLIHGIVNIFQVIGLPLLVIPGNPDMLNAYMGVLKENNSDKVGATSLRKKYLEEIMIHLMRHLFERNDLDETVGKMSYLLDRRLIDVVEFIQSNLETDLSNNQIAQVACVTKDYVGQFFKSLTGRNLQDYIEERRLERAYFLIRSTDENIQQIAVRVGFKDPAYFSRRFKMKFQRNAKDVRKVDAIVAA